MARVTVALSGLALAVSACGSPRAAENDSGSVKIALLASTPAQDSWAQTWSNGFNLAIEDLNRQGGIDGREVVGTQYRTPLDPTQSLSSLLKAANDDPAAIIGFPILTAPSLGTKVDSLGIPFIYLNSEPAVYRSGSNGSQWGFQIRPDNQAQMRDGLALYLQTHQVSTAGILCLDIPTGASWCAGAKQALDAAGVSTVATQKVSVSETDMTNAALDMRGADLVITGLAQSQIPTLAKALHSTGSDPLLFGPASIAPLPDGAMPANLYPKLSGVVDCVPAQASAPESKAYASEYEQKYGVPAQAIDAFTYDSVMLVAAAIKKAGSSDHAKVAEALRTLPATTGACTTYQSDSEQLLNHLSALAQYTSAGVLEPGEEAAIK